MIRADEFFEFPPSLHRFTERFRPNDPPWKWVGAISAALNGFDFAEKGHPEIPPGVDIRGPVFIHPTVHLPAYATIHGPAYIGAHNEIRPGAFLRGNVITGENCVLGNASEFKNALLLDGVQAPHFNYVGDSILGQGAHLGAGVVLSNLRLDQKPVTVRLPNESIETGMVKLGAMLGDRAEIGCNAVIQPGTIISRRALVLPCVAFGGFLGEGLIVRSRSSFTTTPRCD